MPNPRSWTIPVVLGLVLSVIAVAAPIAWDWWKASARITVAVLASTQVVAPSALRPPKLRVFYGDTQVKELYQSTIIIENGGRRPFTAPDFTTPLEVGLRSQGEILDCIIEESHPENATLEQVQKLPAPSVAFTSGLLNPGDRFRLTLFIQGEKPVYNVSSRITGLSQPTLVDRSAEFDRPAREPRWYIYPAGLITLLSLMAIAGFMMQVRDDRRIIRGLKSGAIKVLPSQSALQVRLMLDRELRGLSKSSRKELSKLIEGLPQEDKIGQAARDWFMSQLSAGLHQGNHIAPLLIVVVTLMLGAAYIVWEVWFR